MWSERTFFSSSENSKPRAFSMSVSAGPGASTSAFGASVIASPMSEKKRRELAACR